MQTIQENFEDRTVIILASRYHLIMSMDRVLVMSRGKVIEVCLVFLR